MRKDTINAHPLSSKGVEGPSAQKGWDMLPAVPARIEFFRHELGPKELESVRQTVSSLFVTTGPRVGEFERAFAASLGVPYAVGVSSCSMGLVLALKALGVKAGDEVITTPMTFAATPNAALQLGATPVFADIDPCTGLIDPGQVEAKITPRTKAILVVHLYGQLADMPALRAIADRHSLALIEDAAHTVEAERDGVKVGHLGDAAVFSFYATKVITSGDGGAVTVRDPAADQRLRRLRMHGMSKDAAQRHGGLYQHWDLLELGYKAALTDIEAAFLLPQLGAVAERRTRRTAVGRAVRVQIARAPTAGLGEMDGDFWAPPVHGSGASRSARSGAGRLGATRHRSGRPLQRGAHAHLLPPTPRCPGRGASACDGLRPAHGFPAPLSLALRC